MWAQQVTNGFPAMGNIGELGVYPVYKSCTQTEIAPDRPFENVRNRIKARMPRPADPDANRLWEEATDQVT